MTQYSLNSKVAKISPNSYRIKRLGYWFVQAGQNPSQTLNSIKTGVTMTESSLRALLPRLESHLDGSHFVNGRTTPSDRVKSRFEFTFFWERSRVREPGPARLLRPLLQGGLLFFTPRAGSPAPASRLPGRCSTTELAPQP